MQNRIRLLAALCVLFVVNNSSAQQNIYLNEAYGSYNRVRVFSNVDKINYGPDSLTVWSDNNSFSFDVSYVGSMGFREMDPWRAKLLPQKYWADFDYDITFDESDKDRVRREPVETDSASVQYDDYVEHSTWNKTVNIAYTEDSVYVTGDIDSLKLTAQGAHLTIETTATKVKYILSGTSSDACFKLYSERKACLVLNGVNLTNPTGPVINSQLKKRLFIELLKIPSISFVTVKNIPKSKVRISVAVFLPRERSAYPAWGSSILLPTKSAV